MTEQESNNEANQAAPAEVQKFSDVTEDIAALVETITEKCVGPSGMEIIRDSIDRAADDSFADTRRFDEATADKSYDVDPENDTAAYDNDPLFQLLGVRHGLARMGREVIGDHEGYQLSDIRPGMVFMDRVERTDEGYGIREIVFKVEGNALRAEKVDGLALDTFPLTDAEGQLAETVNDRLTYLHTLYYELADQPVEEIWTILKGDVHGL